MPGPRTTLQRRARYARTPDPGGLLIGGRIPSGQEPAQIWYWGDDRMIFQPLGQPPATMSAVTRATSLIVNTLTALPWRLLAGSSDPLLSLIELPAPRWISDPTLMRSDERYGRAPIAAALRSPRSAFYAAWMRSTLCHGMGFMIFEEAADGAPIPGTLRILNPSAVAPQEEPYVHRRIAPKSSGAVDTDFDGRFMLGDRVYRLVEMNNPLAQPDDLGCTPGVLEMHAAELGLSEQAIAYARGMYRSGVPAGYLKVNVPNFTQAKAQQLQSQWLAAHGGDERSIAVLNATTDFHPIQLSPIDAALIEMRKLSMVDIANMFGVPIFLLNGDTSGQPYSNAESRSLDFRQYSLMSWARQVEEILSSLLPLSQNLSIDFRGMLRSDTATRYEAYGNAQINGDAGWLTRSEIRTLEGLPPLPESVEGVPTEEGLPAPEEV